MNAIKKKQSLGTSTKDLSNGTLYVVSNAVVPEMIALEKAIAH